MTTQDITRFLFQPKKHYVGGQLQQGRVLLDSDFNEDAWLTDEDQRRVLKDIVGPAGSPDGGFSLDLELEQEVRVLSVYFNVEVQEPPPDPEPPAVLLYPLKPGSLYLCGLRFELEPRTTKDFVDTNADVVVGDWQVFQRDHLEMTYEAAPKPMGELATSHAQLAYVEGWEQCVSAVEDEEVLEKALGGVDTSVRVRRMARVHVAEVAVSDTCASAWASVQEELETAHGGTFAADGCEFNSSARLQITFPANAGDVADACSPCVPGDVGRYLGAENQAIRIMLTPNGYVFGVNNAAPIYRVQVGAAAGGQLPVVMLTPPRDEFRWPLRNTVVELIGWSAILPNGEKVAAEIGKFFRVTGSYDPATRTFHLDDGDQAAIEAIVQHWDDRHPDNAQLPNDADPELTYLFMRIWHQVDESATLLEIPRAPGNHALLERLGITPVFGGGLGRPGEYWVVSVRPDTPQQIVPWDLTQLGGVPPHGPRHFFAPLTLVRLRQPGPGEHPDCEVVEHIESCLPPMRSLTRLTTGCCTLTVGDGVTTTGDFSTIQAAIDALPSDGGKICILPGVYTENVVLTTGNVTLEGCGSHTILRSPGSPSDGAAVIHVLASDVTVRSLAIEARGQIGVLVGEEDPLAAVVASSVVLEDLEISADRINDGDRRARSTIDIRRGERVEIRGCDLTMTGFLTDDSVVYLHGAGILLFDSRLTAFRPPVGFAFGAWGGVQIAGGSTDVELRQNTISGGYGHGVTLGSLAWLPEGGGSAQSFGLAGFSEVDNGCPMINPAPEPTIQRSGLTFNSETMGDIDGVRIIDNRIEGMGANGISVLTLNRLTAGEDTDIITVDNLTIEGNRIVDNIQAFLVLLIATSLTKQSAKAKTGQDEVLGQLLLPGDLPAAAILLADGENVTIRNNVIRDNGKNDPDAVCGICIGFGNGVVIEGNRVQNNGRKFAGFGGNRAGVNAGIFVFFAGVSTVPEDLSGNAADLHGSSLRVLNNIVEQPAGLALFARATGPVAIEGNYLESRGNNNPFQSPNQTFTVQVLNNGLPWEAVDVPEGEPNPANWDIATRADLLADAWGANTDEEVNPYGFGGRVLFANNHVTLRFVTEDGVPPGVAQGFSVSIGSLDDVIMTGNQLGMNIENPSSKKKKSKAGIGSTFNVPGMSAHAIVVGQTATVTNNRVAEGVVDALISLLTIGGIAASATGNTTTHIQYVANCQSGPAGGVVTNDPTPNPYAIDAHNLVLLPGGPSAFPFGKFWTNAVANTLVAGLCGFWLELPPPTINV